MGRGPSGVLRRVGGHSRKSGSGQETLGEVRYGSVDPQGGPVLVRGPLGMSGMCQGNLPEVRDGMGDPRNGPGLVGGLS